MKRSQSPLRYPGGKARIFDIASNFIETNELNSCQYAEPYAGGCGLALLLLFEGYVDELYLNDIDSSIASLWKCIIEKPQELIEKVNSATFNIEEWKKQRGIQKNKDSSNLIDLAFSTLYLNRTNRSGIIKGGVMGGLEQNGKYKMDCRFNKDVLSKKINLISEKKEKIHIFNMDAIEFISHVEKLKLKKPLLMVDPPYYNKGQSLYANFYKHGDHIEIRNKLQSTDIPWFLTYDNTMEIRELYEEYLQYYFDISFSVANKGKGSELFIVSEQFSNNETERLNLLKKVSSFQN